MNDEKHGIKINDHRLRKFLKYKYCETNVASINKVHKVVLCENGLSLTISNSNKDIYVLRAQNY